MSVLEKLTEGIVSRDLRKEGAALLEKWERTGLLEGIDSDQKRTSMARLLENQAAQLLKEASTMQGGDVEGFASVAFPIVRRVFGGLIANDLVSVQPMSLPSGLIFFMDFTYTDSNRLAGADAGNSLYGGGVVGRQLTGGVDLGSQTSPERAEAGFYALNNGYSSPLSQSATAAVTVIASGVAGQTSGNPNGSAGSVTNDHFNKLLRHDPDLSGSAVAIATVAVSTFPNLNDDNLIAISVTGSRATAGATLGILMPDIDNVNQNQTVQVRRLTQFSQSVAGTIDRSQILLYSVHTGSATAANILAARRALTGTHGFVYPTADVFQNAGTDQLGAVVGATDWLLESDGTSVSGDFGDTSSDIPEIDIKVDSVSVTAVTKKLKAKWTPELGQDLNAYHNLDAEVELTSVLSEQIALEIDREILQDLIQGSKAGQLHWSRRPGTFLNREDGTVVSSTTAAGPDFTGTVSEWYETLVETINEVSARIHRKTLRGGANFVVCGPEVANLLEFTAGFRANVTVDSDKGDVGAVKVGNLSKKWDIYVDPYFPRSTVLVGRKGGSFLESGYVYAPYVPLQVTPTIFGTEDFIPRKGVMTRYAKKMVRPDMYGLVTCHHLLG
jgi:hypothetical protein